MFFFYWTLIFLFLMGFSIVFQSWQFKCIYITIIASKATQIYAMVRITGNDS
jgi:hypothetical protein